MIHKENTSAFEHFKYNLEVKLSHFNRHIILNVFTHHVWPAAVQMVIRDGQLFLLTHVIASYCNFMAIKTSMVVLRAADGAKGGLVEQSGCYSLAFACS